MPVSYIECNFRVTLEGLYSLFQAVIFSNLPRYDKVINNFE
jgi:hypothetical protein